MLKSLKKTPSRHTLLQSVFLSTAIYLLFLFFNTYIPHRVFSIPSPILHFEQTQSTTFPIEFSFCYDFENIFTDGKFNTYPKNCIDHLMTDDQGYAQLPFNTITSSLRFAHIGNLSIHALGVKDGQPCVYIATLLPDPWRSGIGGDMTSYGFSEVHGQSITLTCNTDLSVSSVKVLRTPPPNP